MSNFDFYKKKFPNDISEKSVQSIMLTIVNLEIHVVSIRFSRKNGCRRLLRACLAI
jgi:hypothetical protein